MLDILIIAVFIASAVMGFRKGLIGQIGSVAAIIIGILACRMFGPQVTDMIMPGGDQETNSMPHYCATIMAYAGVYIVAYYAVIIVARMLRTVTHTLLLGPLDSIGGAVVSVIKWFMAVSVAFNLYMAIFPSSDLASKSNLDNGRPVKWIIELAPAAWGAFTQNLQTQQHGS